MDTSNVGSSVDSSAKTSDAEGLRSASPGNEHVFVDGSGHGNDSDEEFIRDPDFEAGMVLSPVPATPTEPSPVVSPTREAHLLRRRGPDIQNLFVVRHGERSDDAIPGWEKTASRSWDPPLTEKGFQQAYAVGRQLRSDGYKIDRVVVSPFIRCLQTAGQIIKALIGEDGSKTGRSGDDTSIGLASTPKAHIDYGLTELLNPRAIRNPPPASCDMHSKEAWILPEKELHALLPPGVVDGALGTQGRFPDWPEDDEICHARYAETYDRIGDQFRDENIVCVTHGEGVGVSASRFKKVLVYAVNYCGFTQAQRSKAGTSQQPAEAWELVTQSEESGVYWSTP